MGGCNDNPTQAQFAQQEVALSVISSNLISDLRGNTEGWQRNREHLMVDDMHLPKKRPLRDHNCSDHIFKLTTDNGSH